MYTPTPSGLALLTEGSLRAGLSAALALTLSGCGDTGAADASGSLPTQAMKVTQGKSMQGTSIQGLALPSLAADVVCTEKNGRPGLPSQRVTVQGTTLQCGTDALAAGTVLGVIDSRGASTSLRITKVQSDWQDASGETTLYAIEAQVDDASWVNLCEPDAWGERWAIAVSGSWDASGAHIDDPARFTLGCTSGVIAKCVRWGYKPWKTAQGRSLAPYHQTCTRMARADYCGTGVSHTVNGTQIDVYDVLGLQTRTADPTLSFEAAWGPSGAVCIAHARWLGVSLINPVESMSVSLLKDCAARGTSFGLSDLSYGNLCLVARNDQSAANILMRNRSGLNAAVTLP